MTLFETLRSAFRGITTNKLRSALTLLGVMIGVAAVILLLAVGNGSSQQINSLITQLGTNTLTVRAGSGFGFGGGTASSDNSTKKLTLDVANRLADAGLGHVDAVVPQVDHESHGLEHRGQRRLRVARRHHPELLHRHHLEGRLGQRPSPQPTSRAPRRWWSSGPPSRPNCSPPDRRSVRPSRSTARRSRWSASWQPNRAPGSRMPTRSSWRRSAGCSAATPASARSAR